MLRLFVVGTRLFFAFCLFACSDGRTSLGNSAESGNPEIAGVVRLSDGSAAVGASVRLVPAAFSAAVDVLDSVFIIKTDSLGAYAFDTVPEGMFSLEAVDSAGGELFLVRDLSATRDSSLRRDCFLTAPGRVRLGAHGFDDGTTGFVYVPGTTILRPVTVEFGNLFIDSLPADSLWPLVFVSDDGYSLSLSGGVTVYSDSTVSVDASSISLAFRVPLNTTASGIALSENLTKFPLSIVLDSSVFDPSPLADVPGSWTAVLDGDTIPLDLSSPDYAKELLSFWVRVPTLSADAEDTLLLYFDERGPSPFADSSDRVFSSGFIAAWHFDEGADSVRDATGNGWYGVPESLAVSGESAVGGALYYAGNQGSVTIPNSATGDFDFGLGDPRTISVWVRLEDTSLSHIVYGKGASQYHLTYLATTGWLYEAFTDEVRDSVSLSSRYWYVDTAVTENAWTFIVVVQDDSTVSMFVDDSLITSSPSIGTYSTARVADSLFVIGKLIYPADDPTDIVTHYFKGVIDELHVSRETRSAAWIHAAYANQNPKKRWPVPERIR